MYQKRGDGCLRRLRSDKGDVGGGGRSAEVRVAAIGISKSYYSRLARLRPIGLQNRRSIQSPILGAWSSNGMPQRRLKTFESTGSALTKQRPFLVTPLP